MIKPTQWGVRYLPLNEQNREHEHFLRENMKCQNLISTHHLYAPSQLKSGTCNRKELWTFQSSTAPLIQTDLISYGFNLSCVSLIDIHLNDARIRKTKYKYSCRFSSEILT